MNECVRQRVVPEMVRVSEEVQGRRGFESPVARGQSRQVWAELSWLAFG